jgi:hypothetical protein
VSYTFEGQLCEFDGAEDMFELSEFDSVDDVPPPSLSPQSYVGGSSGGEGATSSSTRASDFATSVPDVVADPAIVDRSHDRRELVVVPEDVEYYRDEDGDDELIEIEPRRQQIDVHWALPVHDRFLLVQCH